MVKALMVESKKVNCFKHFSVCLICLIGSQKSNEKIEKTIFHNSRFCNLFCFPYSETEKALQVFHRNLLSLSLSSSIMQGAFQMRAN